MTNSVGRKIDTNLLSPKALKLREAFASNIIGQPEGVNALVSALETFLGGVNDKTRPLANILFLGPTGTGKTSSVEIMCNALWGSRNAMIKVDCAEFQHSHEIAKLVGSPPGYLGHRETHPRITQEALSLWHTPDLPISVILFDEIEKASDSLWQLLLGILDKATLTLGDNRRVDLSPCILVMTSNIGARDVSAAAGGELNIGFHGVETDVDHEEIASISLSAAKKKFTPEFLNRLDSIVVFKTLTPAQIREILELEIREVQMRIFTKNSSMLHVRKAAKEELLRLGYDRKYNARSLRRAVETHLLFPIVRAFSSGQIGPDDDIVVDIENDVFDFQAVTYKKGTMWKD